MFNEYPKIIHVGGIVVTVVDAAEETRWLTPPVMPIAVVMPEPEAKIVQAVEPNASAKPKAEKKPKPKK